MRPIIRIVNAETGEIIDREMNDDEFAIWKKDNDLYLKEIKKVEKELTEKNAARQSALEKLAALGLTEAEIQALAG